MPTEPKHSALRRGLLVPAALALALLAACSPEPEEQPSGPEGTSAPAAGIPFEVLANATYARLALDGGPVRLTDGAYTDEQEGQSVRLLPQPLAQGEVGGRAMAAVLIAESGGGSGTWVSLALLARDGEGVKSLGQVELGDRPRVQRLAITPEGAVEVDYVEAGVHDPMCCPATPVRARFVPGEQGLARGSRSSAAIEAAGYSDQINAFLAPATAYDNTTPPEGQGEPAHFAWTFGEEQDLATGRFQGTRGWVAVYPVEAYRAIWDAAGDAFVKDTLGALDKVLSEAPPAPAAPLPVLPKLNAYNDFLSQVAYPGLKEGGRGLRFVGRFAQDASPLRNSQLRYVFQGLTADGRHLVVASIPVTTAALPEDTEVAVVDPAAPERDILAHLAGWRAKLDALGPGDFSPSLEVLDAMLGSVRVEQAGPEGP